MRVLFLCLAMLSLVSFKPTHYFNEIQLLLVSVPKTKVITNETLDKDIRSVTDSFKGNVSFSRCVESKTEYKFLFNAQVGTNYQPQNLTSLAEKLKKNYPSCNTKLIPLSQKDNFCQIQ